MQLLVDFVMENGSEILDADVFLIEADKPVDFSTEAGLIHLDTLAELEAAIVSVPILAVSTDGVVGIVSVEQIVSFSAHVLLKDTCCGDCQSCSCSEGE